MTEKSLNQEGNGRISYLRKRINQIDKLYAGEKAIKAGIEAANKTAKELREQYVDDKLKSEGSNEQEEHQSLLNDFQL